MYSISLNVLRKIRSSEPARYSRSQPYLNSLKRLSIGKSPKFIEPMLSEATSGLSCNAGCRRSSIVIVAAPPVVKLMTTLERRLMSGANSRKYFGSCVGWPSTGSRACRCTIAAPASAAATAASAISRGVTGRCGDIDGVWIEPVIAQVMMTLRASAMVFAPHSDFGLIAPAPRQRQQSPVAQVHPSLTFGPRQRFAQHRDDTRRVLAIPDLRCGRVGGQSAIEAAVARAVVGHTARRIELDGREGPHERPAQAQAVRDGLVEVLRRYVA